MYIEYNPNPKRKSVGDCVIRAITRVLEESWDEVFVSLMIKAFKMKDMPSSNSVWGSFLKNKGFSRHTIPDTCPDCYSIKEFCIDHPEGIYVIATGSHAVACVDGDYFDSWDSGEETPVYYWRKDGSI